MAPGRYSRRPKTPTHDDAARRCGAAIDGTIRAGRDDYDRTRHLPWLARTTPHELASTDPVVARSIVERLQRTLRAERRRGRAGHWTYDMNRHIALLQALEAETARLRSLEGEDAAQ